MKSIASMATFPERYEIFRRAIRSLAGQFERIVVYFNEYTAIPPIPAVPESCRVIPLLGTCEAGDLGASGKHYVRRFLSPDTVIFTVDDDIEYAPDYREVMERELAKAGGVVAMHGARFTSSHPRSYLRDRIAYSYRERVPFAKRIHVPGTGTMAYRVGDLAFDVVRDFHEKNMDDPLFGVVCEKQGVQRIVVPHEADWCTPIPFDGFKIHQRYQDDDEGRSEIIRSIRWKIL